jgi:hypothetical protein
MSEVVGILQSLGLPLVAVLVIAYVLLFPDKAKQLAGWFWTLIARIWRRVDKRAVANRVEGDINWGRKRLLRHAPDNLIESKLRIRWTDAEEAKAAVENGEIIVFMRRSECHEDNVAHALMAYLPRAIVPRARRYIDEQRMRASDLTVAKSLVTQEGLSRGLAEAFFERYFDPAKQESPELKQKLEELDQIDLHGWLVRVLLVEFLNLGEMLYPGEPNADCLKEAESFARWLYELAMREPGTEEVPLEFDGRFFRVAVILVALRGKLEASGPDPYIRRAKRFLEMGTYDSVYLFGRDDNMSAVSTIAKSLQDLHPVGTINTYRYALRRDFPARTALRRRRAIIVCARRRADFVPPSHSTREGTAVVDLSEVETNNIAEGRDGDGATHPR